MGQRAGGQGGAFGFTAAQDYVVITDGGLCREEVWRLPVELVRTAEFPPADLWTIPGVPIPATPQGNSAVGATTNLHGAQLRLAGVLGPDCPTPKARRMLSS